jgi:hypothetical protein
MNIKLNKEELAIVRQQARLRHQLTSLTRKTNEKKSKYDDFKIDVMGVKAEVGFAKLFNKPIILDRGIDDGTDFYLHNISIDVKGTFDNKLWFKRENAFKSDVAVLMQFNEFDESIIHCLGFTNKVNFIENHKVNQSNGTLFLEIKYLWRIDRLWYQYQSIRIGVQISEY